MSFWETIALTAVIFLGGWIAYGHGKTDAKEEADKVIESLSDVLHYFIRFEIKHSDPVIDKQTRHLEKSALRTIKEWKEKK